jgi:hypothetical protein
MYGFGVDQINEVNIVDNGTIYTKRIPSKVRLYGFSAWVPGTPAGQVFKFYDGDSRDNLLWTTRFWQHGLGPGTEGWNYSNVMMQDDSYIEVNDGLHYEVETDVGVTLTDCMITVYF